MDVFLEEEPANWCSKKKLPYRQISFGLKQLIEKGIAQHMKQVQIVIEQLQTTSKPEESQSLRENLRQVLSLLMQDLRQIEEMKQNVKDEDLDMFENSTDSIRRDVHGAIQTAKLVVTTDAWIQDSIPLPNEPDNLNKDSDTVAVNEECDLQESVLMSDNDTLKRKAQTLHTVAEDIENLKEIMTLLGRNFVEQGKNVEAVEQHVENTAINVTRGEMLLAKAKYLQTAALPLVGMTVGLVAGGPVGAIAGTRIGLATSMIGGLVGFAGGNFWHKVNRFIPSVKNDHRSDDSELDHKSQR